MNTSRHSFFIHFLILLFLITSCANTQPKLEEYRTSFETGTDGEIPLLEQGSISVEKISNLSNNYSRTGNLSVKLDSNYKYGLKTTIHNLNKGEFVRSSIWQHNSFALNGLFCVVSFKDSSTVILPNTFKEVGNEWCLQTHEIYIENNNTTVDFYVFSGGKEAYFDDFAIQRHQLIPVLKQAGENKIKTLNLNIPIESSLQLEKYKMNAIKKGVIGANEKKSLPAFLINQEDTVQIEIRLKGDWTDHLTNGKESYRIKMKGNYLFMGMKSFSIQHPKTRNYMHEWWMHQLCEMEDILSTKYEFAPVKINGVNRGVFAIEEHFESHLIERLGRPVGPIIKMDETGLWEHTIVRKLKPKVQKYPIFESSIITPFKKNKTIKSKKLKSAFLAGSKLLKQYNSLSSQPEKIFNIEKLAKYYALLELGNVQHGHQWHNSRYYYHPEHKNLEAIGFDMNAGHNVSEELYILKKLMSNSGPIEWLRIITLLNNIQFKAAYLLYLKKYSDPIFIENNILKLDEKISANEQLLAAEIEHYNFDKQYYISRAAKINNDLSKLDSIWTQYLAKNKNLSAYIKVPNYKLETDSILLLNVSLNVYSKEVKKNEFLLSYENFHLNSITIIGFETDKKKEIMLDQVIKLPSYSSASKKGITHHTVYEKPKFVFFKAANIPNKIFKKEVLHWTRP